LGLPLGSDYTLKNAVVHGVKIINRHAEERRVVCSRLAASLFKVKSGLSGHLLVKFILSLAGVVLLTPVMGVHDVDVAVLEAVHSYTLLAIVEHEHLGILAGEITEQEVFQRRGG